MTPLFGHAPAVQAFRDGLASGRLHHAWLLTGPAGIGKALFAENAALRMLADAAGPQVDEPDLDTADDHPIARLFEAGSHPDFLRLERLPKETDERKKPRSEWSDGIEFARNINVAQVRSVQALFATTPALSRRRAVLVDAADDLEASAANALLKSLEEPPPGTVFFLVSHAPERLLPTIRSRCRVLRLSPLGSDEMRQALRAALPQAEEEEVRQLAEAGKGAPGRALAWRGLDIAGLDRTLRDIAAAGDTTNAKRAALADALSSKASQERYEAFLARLPSLIAEEARDRRGADLDTALRQWERATALASSARGLSLDPHSTVFELTGMLAALARPR